MEHRCNNCGFVYPNDFSVCPKCEAPKSNSTIVQSQSSNNHVNKPSMKDVGDNAQQFGCGCMSAVFWIVVAFFILVALAAIL